MDLDELCARLKCKKSWARAQLEARKWPITWVAKSYRFSEDDYEEILRILSEPPAVPARHTPQRRTYGGVVLGRSKRPIKG
jgi:hypothetical protein